MRRSVRITLAFLAIPLILTAFIALWYAEENYRGGKQWTKTRRALEARGESLDAAHFVPPAIPDDQNLVLAPVFARLYEYKTDPTTGLLSLGWSPRGKEYGSASAMPFGESKDATPRPVIQGGWGKAQAIDLAVYQRYYLSRKDFPQPDSPRSPADDLLLALTRYQDLLDEINEATGTRRLARFPINWPQRPAWNIPLGHFTLILSLSQTLRLRACASLVLGRTDDALRDIELGWRLNDAVSHDPLFISGLLATTGRSLMLQPIWEGLASRRWTAVQLGEIQRCLVSVDLLREVRLASRAERALFTVSMRDELGRPGGFQELWRMSQAMSLSGKPSHDWLGMVGPLLPSGWADSNAAISCDWSQTYVIDAIDVSAHRVSPTRIAEGDAVLAKLRATPLNYLLKLAGPANSAIVSKHARLQAAIDEAITACALERYFLDHQSYPASLDALVPAYLPRVCTDLVDGRPMRYQPTTADGRYRLWETGWNGRDDDGILGWDADGKKLDDKRGDWVWQYQEMTPPGGEAEPGKTP